MQVVVTHSLDCVDGTGVGSALPLDWQVRNGPEQAGMSEAS